MSNSEIIEILKESAYFPKIKSCLSSHRFLGPNKNVIDFFTQILDNYDEFKSHYSKDGTKYDNVKLKINAVISACNIDKIKTLLGNKHQTLIDAYQKFKTDMKTELNNRPVTTFKKKPIENTNVKIIGVLNEAHTSIPNENENENENDCENEQEDDDHTKEKSVKQDESVVSNKCKHQNQPKKALQQEKNKNIDKDKKSDQSIHDQCHNHNGTNTNTQSDIYTACILLQNENSLLKNKLHSIKTRLRGNINAFKHINDPISFAILNVIEAALNYEDL